MLDRNEEEGKPSWVVPLCTGARVKVCYMRVVVLFWYTMLERVEHDKFAMCLLYSD